MSVLIVILGFELIPFNIWIGPVEGTVESVACGCHL